MPEQDEITLWFARLQQRDAQAVDAIWQAYFHKLVRFARRKLGALPRRTADEEDVALSAMHSFYRGVADGRFEVVASRDVLWRLLVTITARKAFHLHRRQKTVKRGGGQVRGESAFLVPSGSQDEAGIEQVLGREPSPEFAQEVIENCGQLLGALHDDSLRTVAGLKLEGYTNEEIAEQLCCVTRTVERKLERIRDIWTTEGLA
jgi:DNA-directed RNA polymerase specialized sigma24 family protein